MYAGTNGEKAWTDGEFAGVSVLLVALLSTNLLLWHDNILVFVVAVNGEVGGVKF
jgi:hypothetical protein